MGRKVTIEFRRKDEWLLEEAESIVEGKKKMGIKTSLGFEIARMMREGLIGDTKEQVKRYNHILNEEE